MATIQISFLSRSLKKIVPLTALIPLDTLPVPGEPLPAVPAQGFKSLYLLHGFSGSNMDWLTGSTIQELSLFNKIAVFMPSCGNTFYLDDKERSELYQEFTGKELVEFTRQLFPLSHRKEDTFIGGLSMGGFGALHTGFAYPETFSRIIALSSALIIHNIANIPEDFKDPIADYRYYRSVFGNLSEVEQSSVNPEVLASRLKKDGKLIPEIFMACGTEDFLLKENRAFHQFLLDTGIDHTYLESTGIHDWKFWNQYIAKALLWALK